MTYTIDECVLSTITSIAAESQESFYMYDVNMIKEMCSKFRHINYPELSVHFALMANDNPEFLEIVKHEGINVFVNSPLHLSLVQDIGFTGEQIIFTASALDDACMKKVHGCGALVNHDSLSQIQRWRTLFPGAPFGIRCNIGSLVEPRATRGGYFLGKESRLGIPVAALTPLYGNNDIAGIHVYVGTDIGDISYFKQCYDILSSVALQFPKLRYIDFGGGFGSDPVSGQEFDVYAYGEMLREVMETLNEKVGRRIRCILEPGRIIGAHAGYFACKVIDVKYTGMFQYVGVNASVAQFPRPLFYPDTAHHPVTLISPGMEHTEPINTRIFGCSTYSRDYLSEVIQLPVTNSGAIIVFGDAGAYCASSHTHFLGFPRAKEILYGT